MSKQASLQHFLQRQAPAMGSLCSVCSLCIDSCSTPLAGSIDSCNPSVGFLTFLAQTQRYVTSVSNFSKCPDKVLSNPSHPVHQLFKTIGSTSKQGGKQSSFFQLPCNVAEHLDPSYLNSIITLEIPSSWPLTAERREEHPGIIPEPSELNCPWVAATALL